MRWVAWGGSGGLKETMRERARRRGRERAARRADRGEQSAPRVPAAGVAASGRVR